MNRREKEQYLREYSIQKSAGKPFFPYAVAKDGAMAAIVILTMAALSIVLGAELGPKANPVTTSYTPRPEWYFFFLFEVLRLIKPPGLVALASFGVPTICMIMLFLLPFYDRGAERRPQRRPIAMIAGVLVIAAMALLTYQGATAGPPGTISMGAPATVLAQGPKAVAVWKLGRSVAAQSGCQACHKIGEDGNGGPGPPLTHVGSRVYRDAIARTLVNPTAPMPSFKDLPPAKFNALVTFLANLK